MAGRPQSLANSMKIVGSVYVYAMLLQPVRTAASTICSGAKVSPSIRPVSRAAWLICQF